RSRQGERAGGGAHPQEPRRHRARDEGGKPRRRLHRLRRGDRGRTPAHHAEREALLHLPGPVRAPPPGQAPVTGALLADRLYRAAAGALGSGEHLQVAGLLAEARRTVFDREAALEVRSLLDRDPWAFESNLDAIDPP